MFLGGVTDWKWVGAEKYWTKNVRNYEFSGMVVFGRFLVVLCVRFCVGVGVVGWRDAR